MKKQIALFVLVLLALSAQAQNKTNQTFADQYDRIRQAPENESFELTRLNHKDILEMMAQFEAGDHTEDEWKNYRDQKDLYAKADLVVVCIDFNDEGLSSSEEFNRILNAYEELASTQMGQMKTTIRGDMKKNKVKELIFMNSLEDKCIMFVNLLFNKPIKLEKYIEDSENLMPIFTYNEEIRPYTESGDDENESTLHSRYGDSASFTLNVVKVDNKYGIKRDNDEYTVKPEYDNEIVLYGSNPGNTYIKALYNNKNYYLLYDKYGFTIASGEEITPVHIPESKEVAYFIIKRDGRYMLYECPEKYTLIKEYKANEMISFPRTKLRLEHCISIELTSPNQLKCVKADKSVEIKELPTAPI